jgi:DNA (cytosine-5)-methyltransferase 1
LKNGTAHDGAVPRGHKKFTVVDLFAGAGGFSRGFHDAGFKTIAAVEGFRPVAAAYSENFPDVQVIVDDIKRVDFTKLPKPDVVIGSPPCEPFTAANRDRYKDPLDRLYKDKIGGLVYYFAQALKVLEPKAFVMENVPQMIDGELRYEIGRMLRGSGFPDVNFNIVRCEEHGLPSHRTRLFASNVKLDLPLKEPPTVLETINDLESLEVDVANHQELPPTRRERGRIEELDEGHSIYHYKSATGKVYGHKTRIRPDDIAPTVMGSSRFIHPLQNRYLTVREHARLMTFPDEHVFSGGRNTQYDEVGEAVPPLTATLIAEKVRAFLESTDAK